MGIDLATLKDFLDLGGIFILALVIVWQQQKVLTSIDEKLTKVLTLLSISVKANTNFNGVEKVLGKELGKVENTILKAESEEI